MKKYLSLLLAILLVPALQSCKGTDPQITETIDLVKNYIDPIFVEKMSDSVYTVTHIATGYYTENDETVYLIGFAYTVPTSETERTYGYKVSVDANGTCNILEENVAVANLLFSEVESK